MTINKCSCWTIKIICEFTEKGFYQDDWAAVVLFDKQWSLLFSLRRSHASVVFLSSQPIWYIIEVWRQHGWSGTMQSAGCLTWGGSSLDHASPPPSPCAQCQQVIDLLYCCTFTGNMVFWCGNMTRTIITYIIGSFLLKRKYNHWKIASLSN